MLGYLAFFLSHIKIVYKLRVTCGVELKAKQRLLSNKCAQLTYFYVMKEASDRKEVDSLGFGMTFRQQRRPDCNIIL